MGAVLGIDAAWTLTQPSGLALAVGENDRWRLVAVAASYQRFLALADPSSVAEARPAGSRPDIPALLAAASVISGCRVDLVAVDMPLAKSPIISRRASDNAVSRMYGGRKCSTHSPSSLRPGPISDALTEDFARAGYPLLTSKVLSPGLIEVYPHPALVELTSALERLPYKVSKIRKYWPSQSPSERRSSLSGQWAKIIAALDTEIDGVAALFPELESNVSGMALKAYEDMLDAVVCAWVGICAIEDRAIALGDDSSAIWIPKSITAAAS